MHTAAAQLSIPHAVLALCTECSMQHAALSDQCTEHSAALSAQCTVSAQLQLLQSVHSAQQCRASTHALSAQCMSSARISTPLHLTSAATPKSMESVFQRGGPSFALFGGPGALTLADL